MIKLSINQCANIIGAVGSHTSVLVEGPSGSGKSSMLYMLATRFPGHRAVYIDCTQIDVGDIQLPAVDHATGTSTFYPKAASSSARPTSAPRVWATACRCTSAIACQW